MTGGEPLLRSDWDRLCGHLSSRSVDVVLVTNGTLLKAEAIERALAARVSALAISIDGLRATHDATRRFAQGTGSAFDAAVAGLKLARTHFPVSVITQVNRTNLAELQDLGRMLGELSVARWQLQLAVPTPKVASLKIPYVIAPEDLERLTEFIVGAADDPLIPMIHTSDTIGYATAAESILRRKASGPGLWLGCAAGIRAVAIKFDGTVRGCSLLPSEFEAGDLHDESLLTIWNDRSRFAYSTMFARSSLSGGCQRCRFGSICRAGCTTMAYFATGTIGDNPYCLRRVREHRACCTCSNSSVLRSS
jgi:radical SAM protein with 4Fe4S-binding SPASM domain